MTDLNLGPVVLGGNVFGWTSDRDESFAVLDAFVAGGGRSIDTADVYSAWIPGNSGGESETIIGEWLARRGRRDDVSIGTKVFSFASRPGLSPANVRAAIDDSLTRLQTDYVDIYYAHRDDESVPQEDVLAVFDELTTAGKIRVAGASNFSADRLRTAAAIAKTHGWAGFEVAQDQWSLVERGIESTLVPTLTELGITELPYSSLASGFLTGKYREGTSVESQRRATGEKYLAEPRNRALLTVLDEIAASYGVSVTAVSLAWLRQQPVVGAPIASARTAEQLPDLLQSATLELTVDELVQIGSPTSPVAV